LIQILSSNINAKLRRAHLVFLCKLCTWRTCFVAWS